MYAPRFFPPSFNPANVTENVLTGMKEDLRLKDGLDLDRLRRGLNQIIEQRLQERNRR